MEYVEYNAKMICLVLSLVLTSIVGCHADVINEDWIEVKDVDAERACTGTLGPVQGVLIEVTSTEMIVTYNPPVGFEGCGVNYEVVYWNGVNLAIYQQTLNSNLRQSYNYWEGRVLCKLVNLDITPVYNGVRGETYQSNQFTDKFTPDIGPVRNITLSTTDLLHVRWVSPIDYDSCPIYFDIKTKNINGVVLDSGNFQGFEWKYDYGSDNNYCVNVIVTVESFMRGVSGGVETESTRLGPPASGSC